MEPRAEDLDRADVHRIVSGDVEAFAGIVQRWQGPLVNLAYRFCRDRGDAEDMAQEAFLTAFRKLAGWREESRFSTWLHSVALNVYRSRMRRARLPEVPMPTDEFPAGAGHPAEGILRDEAGEVVRRSVTRLPARYRDALVLVYFEDLDVAGAAALLGIPEGTMKARLHRGRELLRRRLGRIFRAPRSVEAT